MYEVKVIRQYKDLANNGKLRTPGEVYMIDSDARLKTLLGENSSKAKFVELIKAYKKCSDKREGPSIIIRQGYLYYIGGIETFLFNLTKQYKDRNITIMCNMIETPQLFELSKYADVVIDYDKPIECDIMILGNYDGDKILPRVRAKAIYQMVHGDMEAMSKIYPTLQLNKWHKNPKVKEVICVSESAALGLERLTGYKPKVIYNILDNDFQREEGLTFITLSRATPEKGINRMIQMARAFEEAGKPFIWFLCCSLSQIKNKDILKAIKSIPEFIILEPSLSNKMLIKNCDYLVQLSDTESFCYSAYEGLQRGVPCIITDFPEAHSIVDDGENGYILNMDLSNLDVDKIFNNVPKGNYFIDKCNLEDWEAVFKGEF